MWNLYNLRPSLNGPLFGNKKNQTWATPPTLIFRRELNETLNNPFQFIMRKKLQKVDSVSVGYPVLYPVDPVRTFCSPMVSIIVTFV